MSAKLDLTGFLGSRWDNVNRFLNARLCMNRAFGKCPLHLEKYVDSTLQARKRNLLVFLQ